jgi:hypothetical protein
MPDTVDSHPPFGECNVFEQAAVEAERSEDARRELDRLRRLAAGEGRAGYSRSTGPLTSYAFSALLKRRERHATDYVAGCRSYAKRRLLAKGRAVELLAPRVHVLVCVGLGYRVDVRGVVADREWPKRPRIASALAAAVTGASWSGATGQRQLSRRHRSDIFIL